MRDALEQAGVSATVAHTGSEAVRLAGTLHPELVLCDVGLGRGEMSGYDVARALRADAGTRDAILVAVTGLSAEQCSADATAAGFNEVIDQADRSADAGEAGQAGRPESPITAAGDPARPRRRLSNGGPGRRTPGLSAND